MLTRSVLAQVFRPFFLLGSLFATHIVALIPGKVTTWTFIIASLCHTLRANYWRPQITVKYPLQWSLHLSYWLIPAGFSLMALHFFGLSISVSNALHSLTAWGIGSIIVVMIARISLGHTGVH